MIISRKRFEEIVAKRLQEQMDVIAEPENRVLTLEDVKAHCEGGVESAPLWVEFSCLPSASRWMAARMPDMVCGESIKKYLNVFEYNASFRCWLRKPTEEETAGTPWKEKGGNEK